MNNRNLIDHSSIRLFVDKAALWRYAQIPATEVIDAAVHALIDGVESPSIIGIACLTPSEAEVELGEHLSDLPDLGIDRVVHGDPDTEVIAAAALCKIHLQEESDPEELTKQIHRIFSHDCHPLVEALSHLDDLFDTLDHSPNPSREQLVARTRLAAHNLQTEANHRLTRTKEAPED